MKTIRFLFFFIAATAFAQEQTEKEGFKASWYYGIGITGNTGYTISDKLLEAGVKRVPDVMPAIVVGWNAAFSKKFWMNAEFGASGLFRNKKKDGSQLIQAPFRFRVNYVAVEKEKFSVSAGANFSIVGNDLSVWSQDAQVDIDNLNPDNASGYIRLRNTSYFVGPAATFRLIDKGRTFLSLTMGYDFAVSNSKWKSDYVKLNGTVKENGSQFFANLTLPF
ncbi:hypothetical protein HYN59_07825 [Flavobacterium album]|uniref:Outer membrane protein beta-barrel domain-containing protein n=1 Tax=Flavobacterium album TaxID=2175091 RepID=A0A2S1QXH0_9FLAO|nr:hypothetical protein [Flavobacterium album]AWH85039.1 hypothetical protein HYN59_07825 [Flavobacterium album]